jgi:hypothetical protein
VRRLGLFRRTGMQNTVLKQALAGPKNRLYRPATRSGVFYFIKS